MVTIKVVVDVPAPARRRAGTVMPPAGTVVVAMTGRVLVEVTGRVRVEVVTGALVVAVIGLVLVEVAGTVVKGSVPTTATGGGLNRFQASSTIIG